MSNERDNSENAGTPERIELAALQRDLDAVGSMRRSQLSSEAEQRIFAASDLQLPLAHGEVRPVAGRIVPLRRSGGSAWVRIAAAIAVVGSIAAGAIVLSRGFGEADGASGGGGTMPGRVIADAGNPPNDGVAGSADGRGSSDPAVSPEHFEIALAADPLRRASSLPAPAVAAALESPKRLAYPTLAHADALAAASAGANADVGFDGDAFGGMGALDEAIDLDFDGLSGEFAAIVSRSASSS